MTLNVILVGTGGWGGTWVRNTLPKAVKEGLVHVVAAVDVSAESLKNAQNHLGLSDKQCFTTLEEAFAQVKADACIIASPPHTHEAAAILAMENGCDVLSEKPIADSVAAALRIAAKSHETGRKMGITMTHRFRQPIWTLRDVLQSGEYGRLDYLVFNFNWNRRDGLKPRQANMENTMLIEGAVHHFDLLEQLAGSRCASLYADAWTPSWGNYTGSAQALVTMRFENQVRAAYETAWCNASAQSSWEEEYIRAEFEKATIVLDKKSIECFPETGKSGEQVSVKIPLKDNPKWGNDYLLEEFVRWVQGGKAMETNIEANLRSIYLVFAAIESSRTGQPVGIDRFIEEKTAGLVR